MGRIRNLIQANFRSLILLMLAGGYVMLLAELLLIDHTDGFQLIAVATCVVGMILTFGAIFVRSVGLLGTYFHFEETMDELGAIPLMESFSILPIALIQDDSEDRDEREEREDRNDDALPPALAPLALSGLGMMGVLVIVGAHHAFGIERPFEVGMRCRNGQFRDECLAGAGYQLAKSILVPALCVGGSAMIRAKLHFEGGSEGLYTYARGT